MDSLLEHFLLPLWLHIVMFQVLGFYEDLVFLLVRKENFEAVEMDDWLHYMLVHDREWVLAVRDFHVL